MSHLTVTPGRSLPRRTATRAVALTSPPYKELARMLVSSAENSSLNWRAQFSYIEYNVEGNSTDNRGYTGGIVGFTSKTHDMRVLVERYTATYPTNPLARFLPALKRVDGTSSTQGLGSDFVAAWHSAAALAGFQDAQTSLADSMYLSPAVKSAIQDGLGLLGQFIYYDAMVMHGPGSDSLSFGGIRAAALRHAHVPSDGGTESTYLNAFLDARVAAMRSESSHSDVSRVETAQRVFLRAGNLSLRPPLSWKVYGDSYTIAALPKASSGLPSVEPASGHRESGRRNMA